MDKTATIASVEQNLLPRLKALLPAQFSEVVQCSGIPRAHLTNNTQTEQSIVLIQYAKQQTTGLQQLQNCVQRVENETAFPVSKAFSHWWLLGAAVLLLLVMLMVLGKGDVEINGDGNIVHTGEGDIRSE
ncbi:hypothetical protein [Candidatus Venteria ishoeyi]|uniref:Uncharacterized protein n=1 Tax=Candidatus Venteria ishoeyi TaxID=1899563 RepID=A0A1H6F276_9GAMM|nr:hypothetical protein [Candidatus Venteria ishoeyi]SEH04172.1 Uncharacterised protein [Candidatus Venteria ishoeyi]